MIARQRLRVVAGLRRVLANSRATLSSELATALDRRDDASGHLLVGFEHVASDPCQHEPAEARGIGDRGAQQGLRAEREPDRVARPLGEGVDDSTRQVGIRLWVVRFGGRAVAQQIDADHFPAGIGEQVGEPGPLPRRCERSTPAVNEHHRWRAGVVEHPRSVGRGACS